jgi:rubrerythrin
MEKQVKVGPNRTGFNAALMHSEDVRDFAEQQQSDGMTSEARTQTGAAPRGRDGGVAPGFAELHREYIEQAERIGSVPMPGTVKGVAGTVLTALKGMKQTVLMDKLGERLGFERTGTRLYDALILKCSAMADGMIDAGQLQEIRDEEQRHFELLTETIVALGGDPTSMTPCADVAGVAGMGWLQVISDPRTTLAQALNVTLSAELTDDASWQLLIELATELGQDELAQRFQTAAEAEARHVERVRMWLRNAVIGEAAGADESDDVSGSTAEMSSRPEMTFDSDDEMDSDTGNGRRIGGNGSKRSGKTRKSKSRKT